MDLLDTASPEERDIARRLIEHRRIAQGRGVTWVEIWPRTGNGAFDYPVPIGQGALPPPPPTVTATVVEVQSQTATVTNDDNPQLNHNDNNGHCDTDEPNTEPPDTTAVDDAILSALIETDRPLKAIIIARRADLKKNSHFGKRLRELKGRGLIRHLEGDVYWLASRPLPGGN